MYWPVLVSTSISSPVLMNSGTFTTAPVSSVAGFDPPAIHYDFENARTEKKIVLSHIISVYVRKKRKGTSNTLTMAVCRFEKLVFQRIIVKAYIECA